MLNRLTNDSDAQNIPDISSEMKDALDTWARLYEGEPPWLCSDIKTMNLPASMVSEVARTVTIEFKSMISGSPRADYLNEPYQEFLKKIRPYTENVIAKGGVMFKPYVGNGRIAIDVVQVENFVPTDFDNNGNITGCIFKDIKTRGGKTYIRHERHQLTGSEYTIDNAAYVSYNVSKLEEKDLKYGIDISNMTPISLESVPEWAGLQEHVLISGIEKPLFGYYKTPYANVIDGKSPLGVSIFSRAIGLLEEADKQYSRLLWEFESGERAVYADVRAFKRNEQRGDEPILPHKRLYRTLRRPSDSTGSLFEDWTPTLRDESIINGLNHILRRIEDACGLSRGTLSEAPESNAGGARTATELKIMRQRTYATITDMQKALQSVLEDLVYAMDVWATVGNLAPSGQYEISFEFDDSVINDKDAEFEREMKLASIGAVFPYELRAKNMNEDVETAKQKIQEWQQLTENEAMTFM